MSVESTEEVRYDPEPRWPALIAVIAVAGLNAALPQSLVVVPKWWFMVIVAALLIPSGKWIANKRPLNS